MSEEKPSDANEGCVGPSSTEAGKSSACDGCPSQKACSSGKFSSPEAQQVKDQEHGNIRNALSNIQHVILVLSGKGGMSIAFCVYFQLLLSLLTADALHLFCEKVSVRVRFVVS